VGDRGATASPLRWLVAHWVGSYKGEIAQQGVAYVVCRSPPSGRSQNFGGTA